MIVLSFITIKNWEDVTAFLSDCELYGISY